MCLLIFFSYLKAHREEREREGDRNIMLGLGLGWVGLGWFLKEDVLSFKWCTTALRNIWFWMFLEHLEQTRLPIAFDGAVYPSPAPSWRVEAAPSAENACKK